MAAAEATTVAPSNMIAPVPIPSPVFAHVSVCDARTSPVKVLFVNVCEPDKVATGFGRVVVSEIKAPNVLAYLRIWYKVDGW